MLFFLHSHHNATEANICIHSVISGRTGSGKSLLLAALLGEADILGGSIEMPSPPLPEQRFDSTASPGNWILPSAVAYVAQIPWIENATIR